MEFTITKLVWPSNAGIASIKCHRVTHRVNNRPQVGQRSEWRETFVNCYNTDFKRRPASPLPLPPLPSCLCRFAALSQSVRRQQELHITLSTVEWKEGLSLNIGYLRAATYAFFTNLARWKFAYENRLVEIPRESREKIVYEWCPSYDLSGHSLLT